MIITGTQARFATFRATLRRQLGLTADLLADHRVIVSDPLRYSSPETFRGLQAAIDTYARHMPASLL